MNKFSLFLTLLVCCTAVMVSCSDADPSKLSGATTEPSGIAQEEAGSTSSLSSDTAKLSSGEVVAHSSSATAKSSNSVTDGASSSAKAVSSSSANAEVMQDTLNLSMTQEMREKCDSIMNALVGTYEQKLDSTGGISSTMPSSITTYNFSTTRESFYEENGCFVSLYEKESGVRYLPSRKGVSSEITSLVYPNEGIVLRMLNNSYTEDLCELDLDDFRTECERENGVFRDYKDGTGCLRNQKIEAACAFRMSGESLRNNLEKEANHYRHDCINRTFEKHEENPCTVVCRIEADMEAHCDTTCNE